MCVAYPLNVPDSIEQQHTNDLAFEVPNSRPVRPSSQGSGSDTWSSAAVCDAQKPSAFAYHGCHNPLDLDTHSRNSTYTVHISNAIFVSCLISPSTATYITVLR